MSYDSPFRFLYFRRKNTRHKGFFEAPIAFLAPFSPELLPCVVDGMI